MFKNKLSEGKKTIAIIAITFASVFAIKTGMGSFAKEQAPFNPGVSTVSTNVVTKVEPFTVDTVYVDDDTLYEGETVIAVQGTQGFKEETMEITTDGDKVTIVKVIDSKVVKEAVATEVHVGTKVKPTYILPVDNYVFTYGVGYREDGMHKGMDLVCDAYSVVKASADGVVTHAGWMDGYGYCVFLDHGDGIETRYAHMNEVLVSNGDTVSQGQQIGWSGSTGDSECNHVHMEMRQYGDVLDPVALGYLNP